MNHARAMLHRLSPFLAAAALSVSSAAAYTLTGSHWSTATIPMQLQLGPGAGSLSDGSASWGASAEDALSNWNNNIGRVRFTVVRDSTATIAQGNRQNNVFFSRDVYGEAWGTGVLAVTLTFTSGGSQSTECDVLFNQNLNWDSYRGSLRYGSSGAVYDFHRVAMHEFGHVLGLDHPDQAGQSVVALMNSRISNLDSLASDDIAGAQSLYGANSATATAPTITTQPGSQTVNIGASLQLTVAVASSTTVTYQWWKDGAALVNANAATLALANVTAASAGRYWVVVTNSAGSTTSATATVTVATPVVPPSIITAPASRTVAPGASVTFSVSATGSDPLAYAWRKNGAGMAGATQASFTINPVGGGDAGDYTVVVSNSAGSVTSAAATLVVSAAPTFVAQPTSQSVALGSRLSLSVTVTGNPAPSLQWFKDGAALSGATASTYSIASARASDAGTYTVCATNGSGSSTSAPAIVTVSSTPTITSAPTTQTVAAGERITLVVSATGTPPPTYQWQKNGVNIAGATQATFVIAAAAPTDAGTYDVVVTNSAGRVSTVPVLVTVQYSQLVNLSTRGSVPPGGALTAGFVLRGSGDKPVIVRGIGPALTDFGVADSLPDPQLAVIVQQTEQILAVNDSWSVVPQLSTAFQSVGAFPLPANSNDSASEIQLAPGAYTTRVTSDSASATGIALAEVYDADAASPRTRLVNLSTLGFTGAGDNALVAGFTIQGNAPKRVLVRAIGPGLAPFNVTGTLANPRLDVFPLGQSTAIAANDDWAGRSDLKAAFGSVGAFGLNDTSRDAALMQTLQPGSYTVVVTGVGNTTGYVLVEIYDLDP